jgi:hypothetical protein
MLVIGNFDKILTVRVHLLTQGEFLAIGIGIIHCGFCKGWKAILQRHSLHLCTLLDVIVKMLVWAGAVLHSREYVTTKAFHYKSPGSPEGASSPDVVGEVDKGMYCEWAGWESMFLILKVKPEHKYCYEYKLRRVMKPIKRVCL